MKMDEPMDIALDQLLPKENNYLIDNNKLLSNQPKEEKTIVVKTNEPISETIITINKQTLMPMHFSVESQDLLLNALPLTNLLQTSNSQTLLINEKCQTNMSNKNIIINESTKSKENIINDEKCIIPIKLSFASQELLLKELPISNLYETNIPNSNEIKLEEITTTNNISKCTRSCT